MARLVLNMKARARKLKETTEVRGFIKPYKLGELADFMIECVIRNQEFMGKKRYSKRAGDMKHAI